MPSKYYPESGKYRDELIILILHYTLLMIFAKYFINNFEIRAKPFSASKISNMVSGDAMSASATPHAPQRSA